MKTKKEIDYHKFKAPDFALDDTFIDWIKNPDSKYSDFWEDWCECNTDKLDEVDSARILVLSFQFAQVKIPSHEIKSRWQELQNGSYPDQKIYTGWKGSSSFNNFLRIAAILILAVSFTFIFYRINNIFPNLAQHHTIRKEALAGQKLSLVLPDGTRVKLNAESSIEYPAEFTKDAREVVFKGEGFFEVVKNPEKPFRVRTGNISTEVLGTSFNVNSYPESSLVQIALAEGRIKVTNSKKKNEPRSIILDQGEMVTVENGSDRFLVESFDQQDILDWKDGVLNFDKISFVDAIKRMERWYGVKFTIDEKAVVDPAWRLHGKFKNQSIEYILSVISYPDLFNYKIQQDTVIIY